MKKILACIFAILLLGLTACGQAGSSPETQPDTGNTQSPEGDDVMKILNISNSHGMDSVWLLPEVLRKEQPDLKFMVAELYQSYALTEHVQSAENGAKDYIYYTNSSSGDGEWTRAENVSIKMALQAEHWDIVMFNESSRHLGHEGYMCKGLVDWFADYIHENLDYEPVLLYNMTWSNPTDMRLYEDTTRQQAPSTFKSTYIEHYGFNHVNHYNKLVEMTKKYLVNHDAFDKLIYNATPIQYAGEVLGVPQFDEERQWELYRDYTHLSDFARLIVAYQWYAQMFDIEELSEIGVDVIRSSLRATPREAKLGDFNVTDAYKDVILKSVNWTLKNPLTISEN